MLLEKDTTEYEFEASERPLPVEPGIQEAARVQQKIEHDFTRWQAIKAYPKAFIFVLIMTWTMCLAGYENQAGSIVISIPQFRVDFGSYYEGSYVLNANWQSAISGGPSGAMCVGAFIGSWLADRLGRKWVLFSAVLISIPFVAAEFVATTIQVFFVGKFLNGFSIGIITALGTTYVSEIAPLALRGISIAMLSLSLVFGPFLCFCINYGTQNLTTRMAYRGIFIPQWFFAITSLIFIPFLPESPYYLINKNKDEEAIKQLMKIYKGEMSVQNQYAIMKVTVEEARMISSKSGSYIDCFKAKDIKRTIIAVGVFFMQPMSGISFIQGYSTYYYELAGFTTSKAYKMSIGGIVLCMGGVVNSWFLIDRFGRRTLLLVGMTCLTVMNLIVASCGLDTSNDVSLQVTAAFLMMYNFFYNSTLGPLAYIICSEVPSTFLRVKTIAIGNITNGVFQMMWNFVLPYMFNPDEANMGSKVNYIFTGFSLISIVVFYFCIPETAHRSFEEIDELFASNVPARKWKDFNTELMDESNRMYKEEKVKVQHVEEA